MLFDDLNEKNFLIYAMKEYNNPQCTDAEEFNDDLKKIKYIKRLLNQYVSEGVLKERLLLNHIIIFYNVFPPTAATRILFFKIPFCCKFCHNSRNFFFISNKIF